MNSQGYVGVYKGTKVVVLPQSFEDETNTTQVMDNSQVYIMAAGAQVNLLRSLWKAKQL